jgi:hypothetical protein
MVAERITQLAHELYPANILASNVISSRRFFRRIAAKEIEWISHLLNEIAAMNFYIQYSAQVTRIIVHCLLKPIQHPLVRNFTPRLCTQGTICSSTALRALSGMPPLRAALEAAAS